ncbi:MAG TPA: EthD family reductase [Chloroflexota bacterium]|nr:EthD family reductase [Chloroflexota bacterium]HUM70014.1 EthD family reductase [Chloroflexota bacterium]
MVKISILYPAKKNGTFNVDYYLNTHMPMSIKLLRTHAEFKGVSVERGLGGVMPDTKAAYVAMCHYLFDTFDGFLAAFLPHAATLQADMPNYTDIEPVMQVSEVAISQ